MILISASGCIAITRGTIAADRSTTIETAVKVASKIGMEVKEGPVDAVVEGEVRPYFRTAVSVPQADLFVSTVGQDGYQANGAIHLTPAGADQAEVRYESTFATNMTVGADAFGGLFLDLIRQQMRIDRGEQSPHVNATKSYGKLVARSLLTPIAGLHYTMQGNPYGAGSTRKWAYATSAFGDVMVGLLTAAAFVDDSDTRSNLVIAGVSTGVAWRLISLLGLSDVAEYNALARTDFDLDAARRSIDATSTNASARDE